ncbi:MAG: DUF1501 domain-containing protein [Verrucomicrobiaceae bacterium]|nr:DUF1501 domain-containing protein [Verrucomicrobiaceae bacterium]
MNRRSFLASAAAMGASPLLAANTTAVNTPKGKAEHCIFIWLGGGMGQIDTFDPKDLGENLSKPSKPGSLYNSIETSVPGVRLSEHLGKTAKLMENVTVMRTVNHHVIDEHAFATNLVHTGRMISGNVTYPSVGSIIAHERGAADKNVPAYILIGYPNVSRGPGFLGAKAGYVYLTDTETGPAGFTRPDFVDNDRAKVRQELLKPLMARALKSSAAADYQMAQEEALRLAGPSFMKHFNLKEEPASLRNEYGGEFGQRCLLSRRLVQAGVRFIEVSHNLNFMNGTGWDIHNEGFKNQHLLIQELDTALAALIRDLKDKKLLDKTLIVVATEFGRPPEFDGRGGRGHQGTAFSMVLAGGGLKHCGAYGTTDELAKKPVENPVPLVDFHATIHAAMGIDPAHELMDGTRPVPITDGGKPVAALFG